MEVTIDSIIAEHQDEFGIVDNSGIDRFFNWAIKGLIDMGFSFYQEKTSKWIPITNNTFDKPKGLYAVKEVELKDYSGCCIHPEHVNSIDNCKCHNCSCKCEQAKFTEQDCFFEIEGADRFVSAKVKYYSLPLNSKGEYVIPVEASEALLSWLRYKNLRRKRSMDKNSVPMSELADSKAEYVADSKAAKSKVVGRYLANKKSRQSVGRVRNALHLGTEHNCALFNYMRNYNR